jgi:hypothetical protein
MRLDKEEQSKPKAKRFTTKKIKRQKQKLK